VKAVIMPRSVANEMSAFGLDAACTNHGRLSASTAQRVVRFWQVRQANGA
jgi:hypothetical protein